MSLILCDLVRDLKKREKLEKDVHDLKMSLDARIMELTNKTADVRTAENTLKDYEQQIRALHVSFFDLCPSTPSMQCTPFTICMLTGKRT